MQILDLESPELAWHTLFYDWIHHYSDLENYVILHGFPRIMFSFIFFVFLKIIFLILKKWLQSDLPTYHLINNILEI